MIEKLNNTEGVKQSQTTAGQRELLREYRNKLNEVIDAVNDHEDLLYGCEGDDDACPGCCPTCGNGHVPSMDDGDEDEGWVQREPKQVETSDGLFSDFTAYVAEHPGLRFYQALTNWSGYSKLYAEGPDGVLQDLFYETTKGPKR